MKKHLKKYLLAFFIVILPIGGFFILFHRYVASRAIKTAQAIDASVIETETNTVTTAQASNNSVSDEAPITPTENPAEEPAAAPVPKTDSVPIDVAKAPTPSSASCPNPAQILNAANWKETLPTGSSEKPTEIGQATLASYSGNSYFHANAACDGVVFRAPVNGVTTSGSGYPRSELREMSSDGKNMASWSASSGTHSMFIDEAITAIPKQKQHVVAGQIHDAADDVVVIRLEYPKLFIDINGKNGPTLDANYTLGKRFTVKFVASGGQINIYYNGSSTPSFTMNKAGSGNYFKAGAYTQSNCSKEKDCSDANFGEVTIYKLAVQN